ncbi:uncharacterized protein N7511_002912 [Penicillium nucicola]|uniref:uncharacterized protein n=1 Tax=Penicillium nucicola TaxID=1850975 RepID=UPI002545B50C|nr:uncharacterized protein N7511_002912 [Penicillium nucicola]KAJ5770861.1 hypothetical protein N7511_002912 [Penicillium nucicola]
MKTFRLLLFALLSLFSLGQASKLAAPSEMLAMYNAYVLDFVKNGAKRTLGPQLGNDALVDFGTFTAHIWKDIKFARNGLFLSQAPEYGKNTLSQITKGLPKYPKYNRDQLVEDSSLKNHQMVLEKLRHVVQSTRGSTASGFSDAWKVHLPEFRRAFAGTQGARLSEMFSVGLKPLFEDEFTTLKSSSYTVLDTDVSYDYQNWGLTAASEDNPVDAMQKYMDWHRDLDPDQYESKKAKAVKAYLSHRDITASIGKGLSQLDSLDSCD